MPTKSLKKLGRMIDNRKLLREPFSKETKDTILEIVKETSYREMWHLGSRIEKNIRDIQLSEEMGRDASIWPALPNLKFIWETLREKCAMAKLPEVSCLEREPPVLYRIECGCGKTTQVETIGPFSALKMVNSFPVDDFSRAGFWDHKHGAQAISDEQCYCYADLTIQEV